jgi:hypothetical protein
MLYCGGKVCEEWRNIICKHHNKALNFEDTITNLNCFDYNLVSPGCKGSTLQPIETAVAETYPYKSFDLSKYSLMNPLMFFPDQRGPQSSQQGREKSRKREK